MELSVLGWAAAPGLHAEALVPITQHVDGFREQVS